MLQADQTEQDGRLSNTAGGPLLGSGRSPAGPSLIEGHLSFQAEHSMGSSTNTPLATVVRRAHGESAAVRKLPWWGVLILVIAACIAVIIVIGK